MTAGLRSFLENHLRTGLDHTRLCYEEVMSFSLSSKRTLRDSIRSSGQELLIPIEVKASHHFTLNIKARGSWPLVSIETRSGETILGPSSYNSDLARTPITDPDLIGEQDLFAKVSMQSGRTGRFRLKLKELGNLDDIRDDVIRLTNQKRLKRGLDPLTGDNLLHEAAQGHADEMDDLGRYLGHDSADGRDPGDRIDEVNYDWRAYRENVASGQRTAKEVVRAWMKSPGHRRNILSDDISEIGIGFAVDDQSGSAYWVQKFADPF